MKNKQSLAHLAALITVIIWGTTFISTKVLLGSFSPVEILFLRFLLAYVLLLIISPRRLRLKKKRQEWLFVGAGLSGITLYYLLENIALTMTSAGNMGVIVSVSPFFIALLSNLFLRSERPRTQFYIGFLIAISGVGLISYSGAASLDLNPMGDLLAVLAALAWGFYSIFTRKISELGHSTIKVTRHIFFYGILFMIPALFLTDISHDLTRFTDPTNWGNILFLALGASAICFVTWNYAVKHLGAVRTGVYIYMIPVITVVASALILDEPLTVPLCVGIALTLVGLWLSETKRFRRKKA